MVYLLTGRQGIRANLKQCCSDVREYLITGELPAGVSKDIADKCFNADYNWFKSEVMFLTLIHVIEN